MGDEGGGCVPGARHQLGRINEFASYVDMKGACQFHSVGETQFKEWVKLGVIHPRKVSTHLFRFSIAELRDFMDQFKIQSRATPPLKIVQTQR